MIDNQVCPAPPRFDKVATARTPATFDPRRSTLLKMTCWHPSLFRHRRLNVFRLEGNAGH
ncbi:MAG: hypothetical protein ABI680_18785 [Chthoniobacteraceae bacterium]